MAAPPDLRVLCRKLAAAKPADLPALCPVLVGHVLRCSGPLSTPAEQHARVNSSEISALVHKLKTQVNTLLQGRTSQGRFAGMVLAKAIIDVGGWECLRTAEHWVRALLGLLQKPDPMASKELCLAVLVRIYSLLQEYPTLVREIATPTVPTFATTCLQLIRPAGPGEPPKSPLNFVETVTKALATLIPLYPTTLRPFAVQIKTAIQGYIAPTSSDNLVATTSLAQSSRRLLLLLHYTAAKNGNADEWSKLINGLIQEAHTTADQVFRAVRESREPGSGFVAANVSYDGQPSGGSDDPEKLPSWTGLQSGAERLTGLVETIAESFRGSTKLPVTVPLGAVSTLISRLSMVLPPKPGSQEKDYASFINPAIGREEREELWTVLPSIHTAAVHLLLSMQQRLGPNVVPLAPEMLEDAVRMLAADQRLPGLKKATFDLLRGLLPLVGLSLAKHNVDSLSVVVHVCCQDVLGAAGFAQKEKKDEKLPQKGANGTKRQLATANADLFLGPGAKSAASAAAAAGSIVQVDAAHLQAAEELLSTLLVFLPQQHVKKSDRALMDRTAILSANKQAMLSSVLNPYADQSGRYFANTVPFLSRAYPDDVDMEILRSNLRTAPHYFGDIFSVAVPGENEEEEDDSMLDQLDNGQDGEEEGVAVSHDKSARAFGGGDGDNTEGLTIHPPIGNSSSGFVLPTSRAESAKPASQSEAKTEPDTPFVPLTLKRKSEEEDAAAPKRLDTGKAAEVEEPAKEATTAEEDGDEEDDDSDESVHLNMDLDEDDEDEESDGDGDGDN